MEVADLLQLVTRELEGEGLGAGQGEGLDQGAGTGEGAEQGPQGRGQRLAHLQDRLQGVFAKHGLEKIRAVGEKYDPFLHEVVCHTAADGAPPGTVTLVTQDGYKLHGRTIRHAHVGIAMETQER